MKRKNLLSLVGFVCLALFMVASPLIVGCAKAPPSPTPSSPTAKPTSPSPTVKPSPSPSPSPTLTRQEQLETAARKEGSVIIWSALAEADKWLVKFKERYPWLKVETWQGDNIAIAQKAILEAKAGVHNVDVMTLGDEMWALFPQDLLAKYDWPNASYYPAEAKPAGALWLPVFVTLFSPTYNSKLVTGADVPKTWDALKDPKWKGKTAATLTSLEAPLALAALWGTGGKLDWDKSFSFWREVFKNTQPRIVTLYTGPTRLMGAGEYQLFIYGSVVTTIREKVSGGLPVDIAPISRIPGKQNGIGILKDAPHPNAARLFADWFTSSEGATAFTEVMFYPSLNTGAGDTAANRILKDKGISIYMMPAAITTPENMLKSSDFWLELAGVKK